MFCNSSRLCFLLSMDTSMYSFHIFVSFRLFKLQSTRKPDSLQTQ